MVNAAEISGAAVGPRGATLRQIEGWDQPSLEALITLFRALFPEYEHYHSYLRRSVDRAAPPRETTLDHVWLVELEGEPIGFRLFSYVKPYNFGFGAYTGVLPRARGLGIGRWLMAQTSRQIELDALASGQAGSLGVVVEITPPDSTPNEAERAKAELSLNFHRSCGAALLDIHYVELQIGLEDIAQPPEKIALKPMLLAWYPPPGRNELTGEEHEDIVRGLYRAVYLQPAGGLHERYVLEKLKVRGE